MEIPQLRVEDYLERRDGTDVVLLDVREPDEWAAGHAAEAEHVPMNEVPAALAADPDRWTRDTPIVVTCKAGGRSAQVTAYLNQRGYQALNLTGGMMAWASARQPIVTDAGEPGEVL